MMHTPTQQGENEMARYMRETLRNDLKNINEIAEARGRNTYLVAAGRNGYTGLDEHERGTNRCLRNIECGTPKECLTAALEWAI